MPIMSFPRRMLSSISAPCLLALALHSPLYAQTSILGFTPSAVAHEAEIEDKFKAIPFN